MSWEIAAVAVMICSIAFLSYFAKNLEENHWYLKLLFFFIGFFLLMSTIQFGRLLAENNGASADVLSLMDTTYKIIMYVSMFVLFYIIILFGFRAVSYWQDKKKEGIEDGVEELISSE